MSSAERSIAAPVAQRIPTVIGRPHGQAIVNDYEWLRDRSDPRVSDYLEAENAYADALLAPLDSLVRRLQSELELRHRPVGSTPRPLGQYGRFQFSESLGDGDYPVILRGDAGRFGAVAVPVLDVNEIARGHAYLKMDACEPSDDGRYLAYTVDRLGSERYELLVLDLQTGSTVLSGLLKAASVVWADTETLFYVEGAEEPWRGQRLWRVHCPTGARAIVYEEPDRSLSLAAHRSGDGRSVFVDVLQMWSWAPKGAVEVRVIESARPAHPPRMLISRALGREVKVDGLTDGFVIRTDDHGPDGRIVVTSMAGLADAVEVLPYRPGVSIDDVRTVGRHVVLIERELGQTHIRVIDVGTATSRRLLPPEPDGWIGLTHVAQPAGPGRVRHASSSPVGPETIVEHDLATGVATVVWRAQVPGHDPSRYEVLRSEAPAGDGTPVPVVLLRRRDLPPGPRSLVLNGYGCYGVPKDTSFDRDAFSLVDRGVTWAIAQVRGGGDFGRRWHDAARGPTKRTAFTDLVAVAEHLVDSGHAHADGLVIRGRSAGGTLVTGATNHRPDLFRAVVALVPFADPLHVQLDDTMPFTVYERAEWGDPYAGEEELDRLASYCPYTNLQAGPYPAMYVTASLHDGEVPYWQPAKYVARLRSLKTDQHALVLRTSFDTGHFGHSRLGDHAHARAEEFAFILDQLGVTA